MSKVPTVTGIMPLLNGMPYLPETMASIAAQTYRDFELLVWENGSEDGSVEELRKWIPEKIPGRVIQGHPKTLTQSSRELAARASGEWLACFDADDIHDPDRLRIQLQWLQENPEIDVLGSSFWEIDETGRTVKALAAPEHHSDILNRLVFDCPIRNPTVMMRRTALLEIGSYTIDERPYHDFELWIRFAASGYRLANYPTPLIRYRSHSSNTTNQHIASGVLREKHITTLMMHSMSFLQTQPADLRALYERQVPYALPHLFRIARSLQRFDSQPVMSRLRSGSFLSTVLGRLHPDDHRTRAFLCANKGEFRRALYHFRRSLQRRPAGSAPSEPSS